MRKPISSLAIVCALALATSCKKKTDLEFNFPERPQSSASGANRDDLAALLRSAANKPETFTVNATTGGQFTSSKGITYTIDPGIFVKPNGETAQGDVQVTVQEVTQASEMILNDMPTNAIIAPVDSVIIPKDTTIFNPKDSTFTRDTTKQVIKGDEQGGMLNSFGEIKVDASQNGQELELKPNADVEVEIPQPALPEPIESGYFKPIWSTVKDVKFSFIGYNHEYMEVTGLKEYEKDIETGCQWIQTPQNASIGSTTIKDNSGNNGGPIDNGGGSTDITVPTLKFSIDELGEWRNCDVLITVERKTTVLGYFTNEYNTSDTTGLYSGIQPNMLFFKKKGDNTVIKLYNPIVAAPFGKKGFYSYANTFGIGMEGTFLALVSKDGKYFAHKKPVTIGEPANGKNYVGIDFTLQEVSKEQMLALVESMNYE